MSQRPMTSILVPEATGCASDVPDNGPWPHSPFPCRGVCARVGQRGPQGLQGPEGHQGPAGPQGVQGPAGPQGPPGPQGMRGPSGPQGVPGEPGPRGEAGPAPLLSHAVDSDDTRKAASSLAVKKVHDMVTESLENAADALDEALDAHIRLDAMPLFTECDVLLHVSERGSDSNGGEEPGSSLRTLQEALDRIRRYRLCGGNLVICVQAGTYREHVSFSRSHLAAGRVEIRAHSGDPVVVCGTGAEPLISMNAPGALDLVDIVFHVPENGTAVRARWGAEICARRCVLRGMERASRGFEAAGGLIVVREQVTLEGMFADAAFVARDTGVLEVEKASVACRNLRATYLTASRRSGVVAMAGTVWTGSNAGRPYCCIANGVVDSGARGTECIPGTLPGILESGGQYI